MKLETTKRFEPVTLTFETEEELALFRLLVCSPYYALKSQHKTSIDRFREKCHINLERIQMTQLLAESIIKGNTNA